MSHEFLIQRNKNQNEQGYFAGYAEGIFYKAFKAEEFEGLFSGDNSQKVFTLQETKRALEQVLNSTVIKNYPDPERIKYIKSFYDQVVLKSNDSDIFTARFY